MNKPHNVPIYLINVLVYIYEGKEFIQEKIIEKVMMKGFGKKWILSNKIEEIKKRTLKEYKLSQGQNLKIKDIQLASQHGFGIDDLPRNI